MKGALISVPFQHGFGGDRGSAAVDLGEEGRRADRTGEKPRQNAALAGRGRRNDQAHRRGGRLGKPGLAQKEKWSRRVLRPPVQAARCGQIQFSAVPANLKDDGAEAGQACGFLGDPQGVRKAVNVGQQNAAGRKPEAVYQTWRIRPACLRDHFAAGDPQQGTFP